MRKDGRNTANFASLALTDFVFNIALGEVAEVGGEGKGGAGDADLELRTRVPSNPLVELLPRFGVPEHVVSRGRRSLHVLLLVI